MSSPKPIFGILLVLTSLFSPLPRVLALDPHKRITQYDIRVYKAKDGLPMNSLKKVFQDSKGFIWIGTQEGLVRFDGVEFRLHDKSQYPGLKSNFIWDITEDPDGNLWLATQGGGASRFDGKTITSYDTNDSLASNVVNKILAGKDGTIWIGTEKGLNYFRNGQILEHPEFKDKSVVSIFEDKNGRILIGNTRIIYTQFFIIDSEKTQLIESLPTIFSICQKSNGDFILGGTWGRTFWLKRDELMVHHCMELPYPVPGPDYIKGISEDKDGNIWFCAAGKGLFRCYNGKFDTLTVKNGLPAGEQNNIHSVMQDREGCLWFTTEFGLLQLSDANFSTLGPPEGLAASFGTSVCEDSSGNICVGLQGAGFTLCNTNSIKNYTTADGLPENFILSLLPSKDRGLWIGFEHAGLFHLSQEGKIQQFNKHNEIGQSSISALKSDEKGELLIGVNRFILRYDGTDITRYPFSNFPRAAMATTSILRLKNGDIWFGTFGAGLYKLIGDSITQAGILSELKTDGITVLYQDKDGSLWIGSDNHGLYRYQNGEYTNYTAKDGLFCDRLFSILEDDSAKFWYSTNRGIFSVKKEQFARFDQHQISKITCLVYNHFDGMREAECNGRRQPSAWRSRDGRLWFTSLAGVVSVDPNHLIYNKVRPPVYVEHIVVSRADTVYRWQEKPHRLQARARRLEIKYTGLSFVVPERVQFKYRLEGYDKNWVDAGTRRTAYYTNLPHGAYTFYVTACNNDGLWSEKEASIQFVIPPFWYETWWAYLLWFLLGTSVLTFVIRWNYRRKYTEQELKLQKKHASKLEDLDRAKSRFFAGISHEFRTPLTLIEGPLQDFLTETNEAPKRSLIEMMLRNTRRLVRLVEQLLDLAQLQNEKLILQAHPVALIPFLKSILASFESWAKRENIELIFAGPNAILSDEVYLDPDKMEKVFTNLLSNAIKFTPSGGRVTLSVDFPASENKTETDPRIKIRVTDTGVGIPAHVLPHIFDYFYRYRDEKNYQESGSGIGLALTKELVLLHHGEISVNSTEGQGTEFTVTLLPGKAHLLPEEIVFEGITGSQILKPVAQTLPPESGPEPDGTRIPVNHSEISSNGATQILLVEDNPDMRNYIRGYLNSAFRLLEATDGEEGLRIALQEVPNLIISDVMMPKMDGFELCQNLKAHELTSHIPVILLTAKGAFENKLKGLELGAVDYITKPFDKQELLLRIRNLIQMQQELQSQLRRQVIDSGALLTHAEITSADERFLKKLVTIIEKHLPDSDFRLQEIAREIGMSRAHLNRKLKGVVGQKTNEFIRTLRLKRAAELLTANYGSVAEVAYECGFNHLSYFTRCFKDQYGVLPSGYQPNAPKDSSIISARMKTF